MSAVTIRPTSAESLEQVLLKGDLSQLSPNERIAYYKAVCESVGLNPLTKPFEYLQLNGKTVLYALKACTEQLRNIHSISLSLTGRELLEGVYIVAAKATRPDGRFDESTGAVGVEGLKGEARANAYLKAETKAKRRVTLSICGLGMLDESEIESIPQSSKETRQEAKQAAQEIATRKLAELQAPVAPMLPTDEQTLLDRIGTDRGKINAELSEMSLKLVNLLGNDSRQVVSEALGKFKAKASTDLNIPQLRELALNIHRKIRDAESAIVSGELQLFLDEIEDTKSTVRVFTEIKSRIIGLAGEEKAVEIYKRSLAEQGKEHSNQFGIRDLEKAKKAFISLFNEYSALAREQLQAPA
jgi:hypothetical protein